MDYFQENKIIWVKILITVSIFLSLPGLESESLAADEQDRLINDRSAYPDRNAEDPKSLPPPRSVEDLLVVDCLLPGQIRKLGKVMTYLTPRRPIKISALDCEIRGGEYVANHRSNYLTALNIWLQKAEEGDAIAQTYVGEIYQKGLGTEPRYGLAAEWYRKAADQSYIRAQLNLAYLYEKGLGVEKDLQQALRWYRRASGAGDLIPPDGKIRSSDPGLFKPETINFGRYHALIIGNNNYNNLPKLQTSVNDARKIVEILHNKYDFKTMLLLDANRFEILQALYNLRVTLSENDNLLIYYVGHGEVDHKNGRGYWLPVDADPENKANWIPNYAITDILNIMAAKNVLIIADTAFSGILTRGAVAQLESTQSVDVRLGYIKALAKGRSRTVLTSGGLAPIFDTSDKDHSVFAGVLLDVLESNDQVIEGNRLHQEMRARVVFESKLFGLTQIPQYAANIQAGHESGDFLFVPVAKN